MTPNTPPVSSRLFKLLRWPLAAIATLALSALLLSIYIKDGLGNTPIVNNNWTTSLNIGSEEAGPRLKALVAIAGLLASTREDSIYYSLKSLNGEPLKLNCRYTITGDDYDADWWSITAYGWDFYLIPNEQKRYSFNNENLIRNANNTWEITVSAVAAEGNWLPIGPSGGRAEDKSVDNDFDLLLRLYTPGDAYLQRPESASLPQVKLAGCA